MPPRRYPWTLSLSLGMAVAGLVLAAAELTLRLVLGPPDPPILVAPRWHEQGPAFEEHGGLVTAVYQRANHEQPFPVVPDAAHPRVFVLGGSSVHGGSQLDLALEFPGVLASLLANRGLEAEVVNLGKPALDSHSIRLIVDEALVYHPDLLVLYLGHNDLGNTTMEARYSGLTGALEARTQVLLRRLVLYEVLVASAVRTLPPTQGTLADRWSSPALTAPQRLLAAASLQDNLAHIGRSAAAAGIPVIMVTPISEFTQHPPSGALCPEHGALAQMPNAPDALGPTPELDAVLAVQPDCPKLLYARGLQRLRTGHPGACEDLRRANDLEPRPLTASEEMADAVRAGALSSGARLLDLRAQVLADHCVPPPAWFKDNVHFSVEGHQQVASILAPMVERALRGEPEPLPGR